MILYTLLFAERLSAFWWPKQPLPGSMAVWSSAQPCIDYACNIERSQLATDIASLIIQGGNFHICTDLDEDGTSGAPNKPSKAKNAALGLQQVSQCWSKGGVNLKANSCMSCIHS